MGYPPQGAGFPPGDISAAVWTYVTRRLTNLDDVRAARIDNVDVAVSTVGKVTEEASGSILTDGTEQNVLNVTGLRQYLGWIDLTALQSGDAVMVKLYARVEAGGSWIENGRNEYHGVLVKPMVYIWTKAAQHGFRITIQMIAGVNRTHKYNFLRFG